MTLTQSDDLGARNLAIYLDGADAPDRAAGATPLTVDDFLRNTNQSQTRVLTRDCDGGDAPRGVRP